MQFTQPDPGPGGQAPTLSSQFLSALQNLNKQVLTPPKIGNWKENLGKVLLTAGALIPGEGGLGEGMSEPLPSTDPMDIVKNISTGKNVQNLAKNQLFDSKVPLDDTTWPAINQINNIGKQMETTGELPDTRGLEGRADQLQAEMRQRTLNPPTKISLETGVSPPDTITAIRKADEIKPILNIVDMLIKGLRGK